MYAGAAVPKVATEELIDTQDVAEILGLAHRNTVHQYQQRYKDMPKPVFDRGKGRVKLWLRSEIEGWAKQHAARGRTRPLRHSSR
jgi:predicted DNA-binding transcriptional regulator AlpA